MLNLCIYHANCLDGFGAAWIVKQCFGDKIEFFPGIYNQEPPDVKDKNVYIVDFSYKRDVLIEMAKVAKNILIIDHHQTAQNELVNLPENVTTIFDMQHSGAILTCNYFYPNVKPPQLLLHIQDRDLWKFELENTKEILATLSSYPYDFEIWDKFIRLGDIQDMISEGSAILRNMNKITKETLSLTKRYLKIAGHVVPTANVPYFMASEIGNILATNNPFSATYFDTETERKFSLRSKKDGENVAVIAEIYGGGGHPQASGFSIPLKDIDMFELNYEY